MPLTAGEIEQLTAVSHRMDELVEACPSMAAGDVAKRLARIDDELVLPLLADLSQRV